MAKMCCSECGNKLISERAWWRVFWAAWALLALQWILVATLYWLDKS
jgi:hypothetical protein